MTARQLLQLRCHPAKIEVAYVASAVTYEVLHFVCSVVIGVRVGLETGVIDADIQNRLLFRDFHMTRSFILSQLPLPLRVDLRRYSCSLVTHLA